MGEWVSDSHNSVDPYLGSALPFLSGNLKLTTTPMKITFPYVTRWLQIFNTAGSDAVIRVGFTLNGVNGNPASRSNYFHLSGSQSTERLELKVTEVFLRAEANTATCSVIAGYTGIPKKHYPVVSASNKFDGVG